MRRRCEARKRDRSRGEAPGRRTAHERLDAWKRRPRASLRVGPLSRDRLGAFGVSSQVSE
jgi:hypothetical protein